MLTALLLGLTINTARMSQYQALSQHALVRRKALKLPIVLDVLLAVQLSKPCCSGDGPVGAVPKKADYSSKYSVTAMLSSTQKTVCCWSGM